MSTTEVVTPAEPAFALPDAGADRPQPAYTEAPLGAHLVTPRGLYTHHGLYIGRGRVIHYAGPYRRPPTGLIEEISLEEFAASRGVLHPTVDSPALW